MKKDFTVEIENIMDVIYEKLSELSTEYNVNIDTIQKSFTESMEKCFKELKADEAKEKERLNSRYLVSIEGEHYKIIQGWYNVENYINQIAVERRVLKCEKVDDWKDQMLLDWRSYIYSDAGDFIIPFNENQIEYIN